MIKFNFYYSITFWLLFLVVAAGSRSLDPRPKLKGVFLLVSSSIMVLSIPQFSLWGFLALLGITALSFYIGLVLNAQTANTSAFKRKGLAFLGIAAVLAFLAFFKYRAVQHAFLGGAPSSNPQGPAFVFLIGVSYFSFKMIHFLIESYRRKIESLKALHYVNYILFFSSFISGPISRYNHFASQLNAAAKTRLPDDLKNGLERIIRGLFKKFVLVQLLMPHILSAQPKEASPMSVLGFAGGLYAYALYFYFDFSGYSDLAIGAARILGLELPENFNNPFLKRNIRELWLNWHMSLTSWLVDYIYWPVVRKMRNLEYFRRHPIPLSNMSMIITFIVCGMWHGETLHFILWGIYHGLGISAVNIYQRGKRKIKSPALQRYFASPASRWVGAIVTFNFFALGLSLFVLDTTQLIDVVRSLKF